MIFEEHHFEYGDFISREYGLIFAHADTSTFLQVTGAVSSSYIFNKRNNTRYVVGNDYTESPLSFEIDIITDDFRALTKEDRRAVEKILFNKPNFKRLYVDLADDCTGETYEFVNGVMKRLYLNCRMMNPEKIEDSGGRVVGYKCTIECDSGYLIQDQIEYTVDLSSIEEDAAGYKNFVVNVDTDTNSYVYPKVTLITDNSEGLVRVCNNSDHTGRFTDFDFTQVDSDDDGIPDSFATVIMDGDINYLYRLVLNGVRYEDDTSVYNEFIGDRNFIRLIDGENRFRIMGDSPDSITFKWSNRRFL